MNTCSLSFFQDVHTMDYFEGEPHSRNSSGSADTPSTCWPISQLILDRYYQSTGGFL